MTGVAAIVALLLVAIFVLAVTGGRRRHGHGRGPPMTPVPDGTSVTPQSLGCPAGSMPVVVAATYGPADGSAPPTDVLTQLRGLIAGGQAFTVSAKTFGLPALGAAGVLNCAVVRCASQQSSGTSGFRNCPPFISCDRAYDLEYGVDATIHGGQALVWSPYVAGSQYDGWPNGWTPATGQGDWACGAASTSSASGDDNKKKEGFEPIPCLPCNGGMIPPLGDAAEVDRPYTDAPVPQPLLYSTIANLPPARGVTQQLETEPETTVTHLSANGRVGQMADPYLSDAARFGPSPYEIPPGDPGYMEPITDFLESFAPKPGVLPPGDTLRRLTRGRRGFAPKRAPLRTATWSEGGLNDAFATGTNSSRGLPNRKSGWSMHA